MENEKELEKLYEDFNTALIRKDMKLLDRVLADSFVLRHMTGMRQSKREYMESVADGTMNYYSAKHDAVIVRMKSETAASVCGQSQTNAAVYGGGRHTWRLQLDFQAVKTEGVWRFTAADASTY